MLLKGITLFSVVLALMVCALSPLSFWWAPVVFAGAFLALAILAFAFLAVICALVDVKKPQETDSKFYRTMMNLYIEAFAAIMLVKIHPKGLEKTPIQGRFFLVCNHLGLADPCVILNCFQDSQLTFISKQENQTMPIINKFMHKIRCQLLDREDDRQALRVILKCIEFIKKDEASVCVFPEGWCSLDGRVRHFRSGAFKIAQKTKVPIVVCTIRNTADALKNAAHLKPTHVDLHLVDVIQPEQYAGKPTVEIADMVYEMMIADLGEDFRALPEE